MRRAAPSGSETQKCVAFRIARNARLVAIGCLRTKLLARRDDAAEVLRPGPVEFAC